MKNDGGIRYGVAHGVASRHCAPPALPCAARMAGAGSSMLLLQLQPLVPHLAPWLTWCPSPKALCLPILLCLCL